MTKQSSRQQKRSENVSMHKAKAVKSNRKKCQSSSNALYEKSTVILEGVDVPCVLVSSPKKENHVSEPNHMEISSTQTPLSHPVWGPCNVWVKTAGHKKSKYFQLKHPRINPNTRSILIAWLMEVSEAYTLHRQTFYLALDYFDRFMLTQKNIEKSLVQLIGVTCLFIAAKMEEACPPKLSQMAYVTAETYYQDEILAMEMLILKALEWNLCLETAVSWLQLYFQMISMNPNSDVTEPQFPQDAYVQMTKLLDLCIIDINSMDFEYRVLASSVLCHFVPRSTVEKVSGLSKDVLQPCLNWMAPFMKAAQLFGKVLLKDFKNVKPEDSHNIQTHTDYLNMQMITCQDQ